MSKTNANICVLGFDISNQMEKLYAIVLICDGKLISKIENGGLEKIIRLAWDYNVKKVATDNIFELAPNVRELKRIISLFPENTEFIQVNLNDEGFEDFRGILKKSGISTFNLTPQKTAYYLAYLAYTGYGTSLIKKQIRTKIIVRKNRSYGPGGMSNNRYKRKVRVTILQITNDIKDVLDKNNFDYELLYRKSGAGIDGAIFTVYTPRSSLIGLIKPRQGTSVSIEIKNDLVISFAFKKEKKEDKPIIVGIDPGLNFGIAILDIEGNLLYLGTKRSGDREEIIELIQSYGSPVIIAADVKPVPDTVKKIASKFNAELFIPEESLSVEVKREMAFNALSGTSDISLDSHMRDAYSAAYNAFKTLSKKLKEVDEYLLRTGLSLSSRKIKQEVIKGKAVSDAIEEELKRILSMERENKVIIDYKAGARDLEKKLNEELEKIKKENILLKAKINKLYEELKNKDKEIKLAKKNVQLVNINSSIERTMSVLKESISELNKQLEAKNLDIKMLEERVKEYEDILDKLVKGEYIPVPIVSSLTKSNLNKLLEYNVNLIYVENPDSYQSDIGILLKNKNIRGILISYQYSENSGIYNLLKENGIPVVSIFEYDYKKIKDIIIIERKVLDKIKEAEEKLKEIEKVKEIEKFEKIFNEYREKRRKDR
ncbi:DUF460 domain-containing protein [Fervidicoccus fontis]|uniref:DUF460 domain-containing protein n=2 Tax=Fervidicoccus fontis TaxID=683846 RepID=A0A7C2VMU2_9CREN|nr:DUF460 domain-containing protein [Fervidicoccus fontis]PMB76751.1 MAG: hypothetical protein C0177_05275 [Fervidicoccus fontis]HEW63814.1 DUF460 domain-containing protein [Fervidicoccus fontis]